MAVGARPSPGRLVMLVLQQVGLDLIQRGADDRENGCVEVDGRSRPSGVVGSRPRRSGARARPRRGARPGCRASRRARRGAGRRDRPRAGRPRSRRACPCSTLTRSSMQTSRSKPRREPDAPQAASHTCAGDRPPRRVRALRAPHVGGSETTRDARRAPDAETLHSEERVQAFVPELAPQLERIVGEVVHTGFLRIVPRRRTDRSLRELEQHVRGAEIMKAGVKSHAERSSNESSVCHVDAATPTAQPTLHRVLVSVR